MHEGTAVFGSRFLKSNPTTHWRFLLGNKVLTLALRILFGGQVTDCYTCYKLLPTSMFKSLQLSSNGFELEAEITAQCFKQEIPIREVPIVYHPRSVEEGKKISWKDAVKGLWTLWKLRMKK